MDAADLLLATMTGPAPREPLENLVGAALRPAEDDHLAGLLAVEEFLEEIELPRRIDGEIELLDRLDGDIADGEIEDLRIAHVAGGEFGHRRRNGRREKERLATVRTAPENLLDVGAEPDVEHPVGLIERDDLQTGELERPPTHVIEDTAGGADDHRRILGQLVDLPADRLAAVNRHAVDLRAVGELFELVTDLHGEFAGRDEDEGPRPAAATLRRLRHPLEDRQDERAGLAGAGAGLTEDIDPLEGPRDQPRLHRRGDGVTGPLDGGQCRRGETELGEVAGDSGGLQGNGVHPVGIGR